MNIKISLLREGAEIPTYGSQEAAGADLYALLDEEIVSIQPGQSLAIPTGISLEIPSGYVGLIFARSGLSCKHGLAPANKVGVIDSDYRGEIIVVLHNHGNETKTVENHQRIAQLVITPYQHAEFFTGELSETERGRRGFGSTGK